LEGKDRNLRRCDHLVLLRGGEKELQGLVKGVEIGLAYRGSRLQENIHPEKRIRGW
jgi:hypothetical protein